MAHTLFGRLIIGQLALVLVACGGQSQTVTRNDEATFVTLESIATNQFGELTLRGEYSLPSQYQTGVLHHKRMLQPNLTYIPFSSSASYDFIVWNGDDNAEHDASGSPVLNGGTPSVDVNGDGLYLGRVTKTTATTPVVELLRYFPPQSLSVSTPFTQGNASSVYPHRLMGAALDASDRINIARVIGNDVIVSSIEAGSLTDTSPSVTTTDLTINQKLQASLLEKLEYQVLTEMRDSAPTTECMGSASLVTASGSTEFLALAYNRGYTFDSDNGVVGEPFARYDVYSSSGSGDWNILKQNTTRELNMQELRTVRTHRSCSDKVASHHQHDELLVASYTDVGNIRLAFINTTTRLQSKNHILRDVTVDNSMDIVGIVPLPDDLRLADGSVSNLAYALLLRYTSLDKLALHGREHASLVYFVINNGTLIPANDAVDNIQFVFPDIIGGINNVAVGRIGNFVAVAADGYLTLLNATGTIARGPFAINGGYGEASGYGEHLFLHSDGSLGWVEYPTTTATSTVRIFSYLPR